MRTIYGLKFLLPYKCVTHKINTWVFTNNTISAIVDS